MLVILDTVLRRFHTNIELRVRTLWQDALLGDDACRFRTNSAFHLHTPLLDLQHDATFLFLNAQVSAPIRSFLLPPSLHLSPLLENISYRPFYTLEYTL